MNCAQVLRVDKTGFPVSWLTPQAASLFICADRVLWFHGDVSIVLRGGTNHQGQRSELGIPAIIATQGVDKAAKDTPALSNQLLFLRDNYTCLYCGIRFASRDLSRDHIIPVSRGGADTWT
ncbi:MAG: HNH endonuclease [Pseudomonadales bacterium]|nr:HNH endonuclease [Pseudomonadales bacterium]